MIKGTKRFCEVLASYVRPLGRVANNYGFQRDPFLLNFFLQELNLLTGGKVIFLYGGTDCVSDIEDVAAILTAGLLTKVDESLLSQRDLLTQINCGVDNLSSYFYPDVDHL